MCGIAGYFGARPLSLAAVEAMMAAIARRGPDARHQVAWDADWRRVGEYPPVAASRLMLHTRLSIRDPRPEADQPMANDDGTIWLCYNGEVYGWEGDSRQLSRSGHVFRSRCDTEFILRGYETWGLDGLLPRLRGMFAFAILDLRRGKVVCARDRLGLKPFVFRHDPARREFAFGSLVRSVLPTLAANERELSPEAIDAYLTHRTIPAPRTVFRRIERLESAHCLEYDLASGVLTKRRYWQAHAQPGDLAQTLDEAIVLRTVADRPVGVFLSSGIDSTVLASRLAANGYANISTFTAGFDDPRMDESPLAAAIAAELGMPNTRISIGEDAGADFAQIVTDLDEPFADPSVFPTWYLARATTREAKVVLCGDGGDELFAGYKRYRQHMRSAWRRHLPHLPRPDAAQLVPSRGTRLALEASLSWIDAYPLRFSGFSLTQRRALQPGFATQPHWWRMPGDLANLAPLQQLMAIDFENYLPEYILRKADLVTMAHGLEARAPLLDHRLVECVAALPDWQRFTRPSKRVLVALCKPCQHFNLIARNKRGFNPPLTKLIGQALGKRVSGIGQRLEKNSFGQLQGAAVDAFVDAYSSDASLAEQVLQLLLLDESLAQLRELSLCGI